MPRRKPRTHRIVELNPGLDFHHERSKRQHGQTEQLFTPLEQRVSAPNYWTNVEQRRVHRKEPYVPTLNDLNAIINGACNIPPEWLNRQVRLIRSHQRDKAKSNDEWYALHCIRGCTYFNCAYVYYNYHVSTSNLINFHSTTRWDISAQADVLNFKNADQFRHL